MSGLVERMLVLLDKHSGQMWRGVRDGGHLDLDGHCRATPAMDPASVALSAMAHTWASVTAAVSRI